MLRNIASKFDDEEREELLLELEKYRETVSQLEKVRKNQARKIKDLEFRSQEKSEQLDKFTLNPSELSAPKENSKAQLEKQVQDLTNREQSYVTKIKDLQQVLVDLMKTAESAERSSAKWHKAHSDSSSRICELEAEVGLLRKKTAKLALSEQAKQSLEQQLAAEQSKTAALERVNENLQSLWGYETKEQADEPQSLFSEVEDRRLALEKEHKALRESHTLLKRAHTLALQQTEQLKSQVARATQLLQAKESEGASSNRLQTLMTAISQLEAENEDLKRRVSRLQQTTHRSKLSPNTTAHDANGLAANKTAAGVDVIHNIQLESLERQLRATVKELETTQIMRTSEVDRIRELEGLLADKETRLAALQQEHAQLNFMLRDQKERSKQLQAALCTFLESKDGAPESLELVLNDELAGALESNESSSASSSFTKSVHSFSISSTVGHISKDDAPISEFVEFNGTTDNKENKVDESIENLSHLKLSSPFQAQPQSVKQPVVLEPMKKQGTNECPVQ